MSVVSACRTQGWKSVLMGVSLLALPVWADDVGALRASREKTLPGALLLEVQPPALDGSHFAGRIEIAPTEDVPFAFGLVARASGWNHSFGASTRFEGADAGEVKLNYAVGVEGRLRLASFAGGAVSPFLGVTAGIEDFVVRSGAAFPERLYSTGLFVEPAVGVLYRPGAGAFGVEARVGPGFNFTDVREFQTRDGELRLRPVYPTASVGLLVVL